jgi:hypothetical protein
MALVSALVSAAGMTTPPNSNGVAAVLSSLELPTKPSSVAECPLTKPIVILKAARAASTDLYDKLLKILPGCHGYPEISHDDDLLRNGCTPKAVQYQEAVWNDALRKNAIITHNPSTQGGGCFSSYFDGADRLSELLAAENATVISWTRNNVLRQRYSEFLTAATNDFTANVSKVEKGFIKWNATGNEVVKEVVNGACEMLAIQSAAKKCTTQRHRHVVYEEYAKDPLTALKRVLSWAELKGGVTVSQLLKPHREVLKTRPDELAFAGSFAYAFEHPDEVFQSLQAVCLDWTFWGGSFTSRHTPRPMCLSSPSCEKAGLPCYCDAPNVVHNTRNAMWLGDQSQPDWWLEQTSDDPLSSTADPLDDSVFIENGHRDAVPSPSPSPATKLAKEDDELARNLAQEHEEYAQGASPAKPAIPRVGGIPALPTVKNGEDADVAESQKRAEMAREAGADTLSPLIPDLSPTSGINAAALSHPAAAAAAATTTTAATSPVDTPHQTMGVMGGQEEQNQEDDTTHTAMDKAVNPYMPENGPITTNTNNLPAAGDDNWPAQFSLPVVASAMTKLQEAPDQQQHLGWVWRDGHYVWQEKAA